MAMNPKDLEGRKFARAPQPDNTKGPGWKAKRRDRRMSHEALHLALLGLGGKPSGA